MDAKYTPGPWRAEYEAMGGYDCLSDCFRIVQGGGETLAMLDLKDYNLRLYGRGSFVDSEKAALLENARANALLMAAAPEMLKALKTILNIALMDKGHWAKTIEQEAHAAINKAEGKPQ